MLFRRKPNTKTNTKRRDCKAISFCVGKRRLDRENAGKSFGTLSVFCFKMFFGMFHLYPAYFFSGGDQVC